MAVVVSSAFRKSLTVRISGSDFAAPFGNCEAHIQGDSKWVAGVCLRTP